MSRVQAGIALLSLVIVGELAYLAPSRGKSLSGPITGEAFPAEREVAILSGPSMPLSTRLRGAAGCTVVVLAASTCPFCRRMRSWWPSTFAAWRDSIGPQTTAIWLFDTEPAQLGQYAKLASAGIGVGGLGRAGFVGLGAYTVPTTYLVDRDGVLRYGTKDGLLPPAEEVAGLCR